MVPNGQATTDSVFRRRPARLLIVDPEEGLRRLLRVAFQRHGFEVYLAASGREALALYQRCSQEIDLVLLDVQTADGDGPQTFAALRQLNPRVRCCFLSTEPGPYTPEQLLAWGGSQVFHKPLSLAALTRDVAQLVAGKAHS